MRMPSSCRAATRDAALSAFLQLILSVSFAALPQHAIASGDAEPVSPPDAQTSGESRPLREAIGFATDAAVTKGLWAELGETYLQDDSRFVTFARAAYGWRSWEFGGDISVNSSGNFNKLGLNAKYVGWKLGPADVGAGAVMRIPTSYGDFDFAPFATASLPVGEWDLRSSFGYVITENFFYDAAALRPLMEQLDFRAELAGSFNDSFDAHFVQLLPGVDVHFPLGVWQILLRASAGAQLHPDPNAVVSLSVVLTES